MNNSKYVIVDIEKANNNHASICQIGLIVYLNGVEIDRYKSLINPQSAFHDFHTGIHGLRHEDIVDAPIMQDISHKLNNFFEGAVVCSYGTSDKHALACYFNTAAMDWLDIATVVRHAIPEFKKGGHKLLRVADSLNIEFDPLKAHDALEDAVIASKILFTCIDKLNSDICRFISKSNRDNMTLF